jgi:hypothetical protein
MDQRLLTSVARSTKAWHWRRLDGKAFNVIGGVDCTQFWSTVLLPDDFKSSLVYLFNYFIFPAEQKKSQVDGITPRSRKQASYPSIETCGGYTLDYVE